MKFDFDPSEAPGVVKILGVIRALRESKHQLSIPLIYAVARRALTPEEIAALPPAPQVPGEGNISDDAVIAWSAFLLWASLSGEL
jgi:hypothetical protein